MQINFTTYLHLLTKQLYTFLFQKAKFINHRSHFISEFFVKFVELLVLIWHILFQHSLDLIPSAIPIVNLVLLVVIIEQFPICHRLLGKFNSLCQNILCSIGKFILMLGQPFIDKSIV